MKFLILHGPNLNLFGRREPHIYGTTTLAQINERLQLLAGELDVELVIHQSNHEGVLVDHFHQYIDSVDGALLNPAGLTQHGVSLHDAIKAMLAVKDKPVLFDCRVASLTNCFPMIPSGKAHNEMLLPDEATDEAVANAIDAKGRELV